MKRLSSFFQLRLNRGLARPLLALGFSTFVGCGLLTTRMVLTQQTRHGYLVWNLFLAWLPLLFALGILWRSDGGRRWNRRATLAGIAWLLFFPNAPYICTDLIHLDPRTHQIYWADLVLILVFALTGLVLGFLSLYVMQSLVARRFGWPAGWGFVFLVTALSGCGIYLGRFQRWNSWDVLINPVDLLGDIGRWLAAIPEQPSGGIVPMLFGTLVFLAYVMFHAVTHVPGAIAVPTESEDCSR